MQKVDKSSFLLFLLYRLSSVFIVQTFYVPDEYWQSLEVAHKMVFGYGHLTWEWKEGLRTYLYPLSFAVVFKILDFFRLDSVYLITTVPKLLQALLTAVSDQYFLLLCRKFGFDDYWAKMYIFTNWFWYYCGSRTITNTFEMSITIIAFYYFPWELLVKKKKGKKQLSSLTFSEIKSKFLKYITLSAINCLVRPTAVTVSGPLVILSLTYLSKKNMKQLFLSCIVPVVLFLIPVSILVDFYWYGKITIPAYNFFMFNIFKDISSFYGTHPFYWYLTEGLPAVLGVHIVPFSWGFVKILRELFTKKDILLKRVFFIWIIILIINIIILSNIPHKEFRFALPLLPLMTLIAVKTSSEVFASPNLFAYTWKALLILSFIILTALLGIFHQRGPLDLINYFSSSAVNCSPKCFFLFLMPCHSTPLYSHLHLNVSTRFLSCEPPLNENFYDESDDFFKNPVHWLESHWNDTHPPSHVAFFDDIEILISSFLRMKGFAEKHVFYNTLFADKSFRKYIIVYEPKTELS